MSEHCPEKGCEVRLDATYEALADHLIDVHGYPEEETRRAQMAATMWFVFGTP